MFTNFMNWRKEAEVDTIIDTYEFPERAAVQEVYPHGYHGLDKMGRPVYYERFGVLDVPALFRITTEARMIRHYIKEYEITMKLRYPACSVAKGEKILQGLTIFDMTGGSISTANSHTYGLCKLAAQVGSDYYPEIMGNMFVVNAPMLFSGIWAVVKGFLDEKTRAKIKIIGSGYMPTLEEFLERKDIPHFLGGECHCDHIPGGCINSDKGPWQDYEIHGNGIRLKQSESRNDDAEECKTEEIQNVIAVDREGGENPSAQAAANIGEGGSGNE